MIDRSKLRLLLPRTVRHFPTDLGTVIILVVVACGAVLVFDGAWSSVRLLFGLPLLFFLPGYAVVSALFPESANGTTAAGGSIARTVPVERHVNHVERIVLSIGASLAVVPLIGYVLSYTLWGLDLFPALVSIGIFTIVSATVAALRRRSLPESERFSISYRKAYATFRSTFSANSGRYSRLLNVVLALSLLVASGSVLYTTTTPRDDERFTEFYLVSEGESGRLEAANYPKNFTKGRQKSVRLGIRNHEYERMDYTAIVLLQRVKRENGSTSVTAERTLDRSHWTVAHNETVIKNSTLKAPIVGERLRLTFLLYQGAPPQNPSTTNAYRRLHLWITVENDTAG